jgi:hypothetical protein
MSISTGTFRDGEWASGYVRLSRSLDSNKNKAVPAFFKDEASGVIIEEFVGLRCSRLLVVESVDTLIQMIQLER